MRLVICCRVSVIPYHNSIPIYSPVSSRVARQTHSGCVLTCRRPPEQNRRSPQRSLRASWRAIGVYCDREDRAHRSCSLGIRMNDPGLVGASGDVFWGGAQQQAPRLTTANACYEHEHSSFEPSGLKPYSPAASAAAMDWQLPTRPAAAPRHQPPPSSWSQSADSTPSQPAAVEAGDGISWGAAAPSLPVIRRARCAPTTPRALELTS